MKIVSGRYRQAQLTRVFDNVSPHRCYDLNGSVVAVVSESLTELPRQPVDYARLNLNFRVICVGLATVTVLFAFLAPNADSFYPLMVAIAFLQPAIVFASCVCTVLSIATNRIAHLSIVRNLEPILSWLITIWGTFWTYVGLTEGA